MTLISKLILGLVALPMCFTHMNIGNTNKEANLTKDNKDKTQIIDLQDGLFKDYYNQLNDSAKEKTSLSQFKEYYKKGDIKACELVEMLNEDKAISFAGEIKRAANDTPWFKEYDDSDFIISDNHGRTNKTNYNVPQPSRYDRNIDSTFALEHNGVFRDFDFYDSVDDKTNHKNSHGPAKPTYRANPSNSSETNYYSNYAINIQEGDIVWDSVTYVSSDPGDLTTHMGIVVNTEKFGTKDVANSTSVNNFQFIETVEADASGVRFGYVDDERILKYGTKILRVDSATHAQKVSAIDFVLKQLGKAYELHVMDPYNGPVPGENKTTWYCTLLVFCAYYHAGINICKLTNSNDYPGYNDRLTHNVTGHMIYNGVYTRDIGIRVEYTNFSFLHMYMVSKSGKKYTIRIHNASGEFRYIAFTDTLRSFGDVVNNFLDHGMIHATIGPNENMTVQMEENGSNTSIFCYYIDDCKAYCTVACKLNPSNLSMVESNFVTIKGISHPAVMFPRVTSSTATADMLICKKEKTGYVYSTQGIYPSGNDIKKWNFKKDETTSFRKYYNASGDERYYVPVTGEYFGLRTGAYYKNGQDFRTFDIYEYKINKSNNKVTVTKSSRAERNIGLSVVSKSGSKWTIRVTNFSEFDLPIEYNTKMCNEGDAKDWKGLKNIDNKVTICANSYRDIVISENFWATHIVVSAKDNKYRYISYANNLNTNGTLSFGMNKKAL